MKKLLAILGACALTASGAGSVVACGDKTDSTVTDLSKLNDTFKDTKTITFDINSYTDGQKLMDKTSGEIANIIKATDGWSSYDATKVYTIFGQAKGAMDITADNATNYMKDGATIYVTIKSADQNKTYTSEADFSIKLAQIATQTDLSKLNTSLEGKTMTFDIAGQKDGATLLAATSAEVAKAVKAVDGWASYDPANVYTIFGTAKGTMDITADNAKDLIKDATTIFVTIKTATDKTVYTGEADFSIKLAQTVVQPDLSKLNTSLEGKTMTFDIAGQKDGATLLAATSAEVAKAVKAVDGWASYDPVNVYTIFGTAKGTMDITADNAKDLIKDAKTIFVTIKTAADKTVYTGEADFSIKLAQTVVQPDLSKLNTSLEGKTMTFDIAGQKDGATLLAATSAEVAKAVKAVEGWASYDPANVYTIFGTAKGTMDITADNAKDLIKDAKTIFVTIKTAADKTVYTGEADFSIVLAQSK